MVKRFLIKLLVAAGFLMLFSLRFVDATLGSCPWEHPLESGWKTTGLHLEEVDTETWTKLENRWLNVTQLKQLARQIARKLHLKVTNDFVSGTQDHYSYITFEGYRADQTRVTVTIQSCKDRKQQETQMGIYTSKPSPAENLRPYLDNLNATIQSVGKDCNTAVILTSKYKGTMNPEQIKTLSRRVFQKLGAKLVEVNYPGAGNNSYKAYAPGLMKNPEAMNDYNVEFSARYDPEEKYTQVQLASPGNEEGV